MDEPVECMPAGIVAVKPLDHDRLWLTFSTGVERTVDLLPLMRGPVFDQTRSDPEYSRRVRVDAEPGTIVWDNGADLDPDVLLGTHLPAWMDAEREPM